MTSRTRNLTILGIVAGLLVLALLVIVPGSPLSKDTKLGLDLEGGIELVYEGQPTPQVPQVTPQAVDDAIETMRKRVDSLGVSEPEIQRAGRNQISVGLPDVQNAERAKEQVGTTARLQFYDWEPNVLTDHEVYAGIHALYDATEAASTQKGKAEKTDIPPDHPDWSPEKADKANNTAKDRYYLFGPDEVPIGPDKKPMRTGTYEPSGTCKDLLADYDPGPGPAPEYAKGTECLSQLDELGSGGPPAGSRVIKVPEGVVVVEQEPSPNQPPQIHRFTVLEDDSELSGLDIKNPKASTDQNNAPIVTMEFSDKGREAFARVTKRIAERGFEASTLSPGATDKEQFFQHFAITLDNQIVSLATIDFVSNPEGIDGRTGAQIENIGDFDAANDLAESLRIGALPIDLKLISETQVSATLGQQALHQGLIAGAVGLALTILFLLLFYRVLGIVATGALLIYAVFLFALVKLIPITLTLPGIAGLVLTLAVAADANIVMYERIKEEVRGGRSIPAAISAGYAKALRTIIDANVVTIGVAFILFTLATAGVKGFAFTLMIGTLVSLFTAVLATSAILGSLARTRMLRSPSALGAGRERVSWQRFDFMGKSRWFFSFSGAILAVGAIALSTLGINFGIDFESGTRIVTPLERPANVDQVRNTLAPLGYDDAKIQAVNDPELGKNVFQIAVKELPPDKVDEVERALDDRFGVRSDDFSSSSIGPTFGEQIARTAVIAVIASLLLISIYIGFRFEWKFAVPILIALAHDLLITSGVYALTEREVTTSTVAALLTIMGYSLYDTIIVFDRIRENVPRMPRATFSQIANRSMSEVLTRSLATSATVLMPVGALLLFGGETLKDFAFALLVGVASGAYSSIFIATPVLVEWKEREQVYMRRRRVVMEQFGGIVPAFATGALAAEPAQAAAGAASPGRKRTTRRARQAARTGGAPPQRAATGRPTPPPSEPATPPPAEAAAPPPGAEGAAPPPPGEAPAPPPPDATAPADRFPDATAPAPLPDSAPPPPDDEAASPPVDEAAAKPPVEPADEAAPSPPPEPADDRASEPRPSTRAERLRAKREAAARGGAPRGDRAPRDGAPADGAPPPEGDSRESRTTSTAGSGKPKPKRQRSRRKHGRR
jgi:SecD/SecF fusion protein